MDLLLVLQGPPRQISCSATGKFICISSKKGHFFFKFFGQKIVFKAIQDMRFWYDSGDPEKKIQFIGDEEAYF